MTSYVAYRLKGFVQEEKGITALEIAILLITFVYYIGDPFRD